MNQHRESLIGQMRKDERGQMLPVVAMSLVVLFGFSGLVTDFGRIYYNYRMLQTSTDAAVLAAAEGLPNFTSAASNATSYSSVSGNLNALSNLPNVSMVSGYPKFECLTTLANMGMACVPDSSGASKYSGMTANAMQIKQQITVPLYFAALVGAKSVTLTTTSTASMRGATAGPYNIAIIVDTTGSMGTTDTNCGSSTRLACALSGVQTLLNMLSPCAGSGSCSITSGVATNSIDRVSLFTFPNATTATTGNYYDCNSSNPTTGPYTFPTSSPTSSTGYTYTTYNSTKYTYQVTYGLGDTNGFVSDYRTSDTASSLSTSSDLVMAVGGKSGCTAMGNPGGAGTYYAGVIYAAEAALLKEGTNGAQNVLIMISDGAANSTNMGSATSNGTTYPSTTNQCQQAVAAASAAAKAGIRVYSVAYGAETTGCTTDSSTYTPCYTMKNIASSPQYFFSDYKQSGSGIDTTCQGYLTGVTAIGDIFTDIGGDLTFARLIPDSTT